MKKETLSQAFNLLDDRHISETEAFSPGERRAPSERIVHMNRKRLLSFALVAALILALGAAAYAISGAGRATATCAMPETGEYTDLSALPEVERIAGYPVIVPESLSDGYRFSRLAVTGMADYDENGEREREYYTVNATYTKPATFDTISTYVVNATKGAQTEIKTALWALSAVIFLIVLLIVAAANFRASGSEAERSQV